MENRIFYYAILCSLLIHAAILGFYPWRKSKAAKDVPTKMEVTYQKIVSKSEKQEPSAAKNIKVLKEKTEVKETVDIIPQRKDVSPMMRKNIKDMTKLKRPFKLEKKRMEKISRLSNRGKIKIPLLRSEKITNIKYLTYNQNIREKIKQKAYEYIDHPDFKEGEVYLTFILEASGILKEVQIIEGKTTANAYLRKIGLRCIRESSPFPPFPRDLDYPELTFNVIISFEVQK